MAHKKHTESVRDACKFIAGFVTADLFAGLWIRIGHISTLSFFGVALTPAFINTWIVIDIVLLAMLVHYGWRVSLPLSRSQSSLHTVVGIILLIVAVAHVLRLFFGLHVSVGGAVIPFWVSAIGAVVAAWLSYASFHLASRK